MKPLSQEEIQALLPEFEGWEYAENALHTSIEFNDFKDAFAIMTRIAFEAEQMNHHPDWSNVYNKLHISLSTHDTGGVTQKDFDLAKAIDRLVS